MLLILRQQQMVISFNPVSFNEVYTSPIIVEQKPHTGIGDHL